jgi:carbonic anhydrase
MKSKLLEISLFILILCSFYTLSHKNKSKNKHKNKTKNKHRNKNKNKKEESNSIFQELRKNNNDNDNDNQYRKRKNINFISDAKNNYNEKYKKSASFVTSFSPSSNLNYRFSESKTNLKSAIEAEFNLSTKTNTNTNTETDFSVLLMEKQRKKQMELEKKKERENEGEYENQNNNQNDNDGNSNIFIENNDKEIKDNNINNNEEQNSTEQELEEEEEEENTESENIYNSNYNKNRMSNEYEKNENKNEKFFIDDKKNKNNLQKVKKLAGQIRKKIDFDLINPNSANNYYDKNKNYTIILNEQNNYLIQDWLTVESIFFRRNKFPDVLLNDGGIEKVQLKENARINQRYNLSKTQGAVSNLFFWFMFKNGYLYYFAIKNDMNILDAILVKSIEDKLSPGNGNVNIHSCFQIYDSQKNRFEICASNMETKLYFLCTIQNYLHSSLDKRCFPKKENVIVKIEEEKVIIIPLPSKQCNENWNYLHKGRDWECICKEGLTQSPILLPKKENTIPTNSSPMFIYERVDIKPKIGTIDNFVMGEENLNIRLEKHAIRIFHPNMGKIIMVDGSVFVAEEIVFHTPAEHIIDGKKYDLEMQVIHYGRSKGDIADQVVLSILFKSTPGKYNKFLDKIDFFNLPNYNDPIIELQNDFFIPSVFTNSDEEDVIGMEPFSFYTYEGSLTFPPCTERTTYIVAAEPMPLSNTVIKLFHEALNKPDNFYINNDINNSNEYYKNEIVTLANENNNYNIYNHQPEENNREIQNLNQRKIYYFDCVLNGCLSYKQPKLQIKRAGHYEKLIKVLTEYIMVYGKKPSGLPGSFVVSEDEAIGKTINRKILN